MIHLICKRFHQKKHIASNTTHGHFFSTSSLKPTPHGSNSTDPQSLTVSYLLNSCGLPLKSAITASKKLRFETADQPDSVLNLLKSYGLKQTHIKNLITSRPLILLADPNKTLRPNMDLFDSLGLSGNKLMKLLSKEPRILQTDARSVVEFFNGYGFTGKQISMLTMRCPRLYGYNAPKTLKPKLDYIKSLGLSDVELAQILSIEPHILERSLENQIMPSTQFIRHVVGTDDNVLKAIKAYSRLLRSNIEKELKPNIAILISHGVNPSNISKFIMSQPKSLLVTTYRFKEIVAKVEKLGFDPKNLLYLLAIRSLAVMSKSLWERKWEVYHSFGLSEDELLSAFKSQPMFMLASEKKIRKLMGFYLNELKLKPSMISKKPNLLLLSLEKRIIPRCSILQLLMSKGIIKVDVSLVCILLMTEKFFVERYVTKYQNVIPEVVEAHQGKMQFKGFTIELKT